MRDKINRRVEKIIGKVRLNQQNEGEGAIALLTAA